MVWNNPYLNIKEELKKRRDVSMLKVQCSWENENLKGFMRRKTVRSWKERQKWNYDVKYETFTNRCSKIMAEQNMISSEDWDQTMKFDIWRSN
jgi:hypothetical protein